jgi:uncharacterized membrane protein
MVNIHHEGSCAAPIDVAFAYVDDYRNATKWMFGLEKFEPVGDRDRGVGARFDSTFHVKPVKLHTTIEVTEWAGDNMLAVESIKGFRTWSIWKFAPAGPNRTRVQVLFRYELPGGLAGRALGHALEPIVAMSLRHSERALRQQIEAHYRAS